MTTGRRCLLGWACGCACALLLPGCAGTAGAEGAAPAAPAEPLRWRTLSGGYLVGETPGLPPGAPSGLFVRFASPLALALRGTELLVADGPGTRLWRTDTAGTTLTAVAGAPVVPGLALVLGPDLSAWVLDPASRQVLRFARDGRLLQTHRIGLEQAMPAALALADGGATLLVADGPGAQWSEQRSPAAPWRSVAPRRGTGHGAARIRGTDALAPGARGLWVLDRLAGAVHEVTREGQVLQSLGEGELQRPLALAVDRHDRVYVHDAQDRSVLRLRRGQPAERWVASALGVREIGPLAIDGLTLAVADRLSGAVVLHALQPPAPGGSGQGAG